MGESEYSTLVTLLNSRLDSVDAGVAASRIEIATSRSERDTQMRELRGDISGVKAEIGKVAVNGCAHREAHEAAYRRSQEDIAFALKEVQELRKSMRVRSLKPAGPTLAEFFGTIDWTNKRVSGLAAILVVLVICFVALRHWNSAVVEESVKTVINAAVR